MTGAWDSDLAAAAAYQEVTLAELRGLFDQLDFDLRDRLERELEIEGELTDLSAALEVLSATLEARGAVVSPQAVPSHGSDVDGPGAARRPSRYAVPLVPALDDFGLIVALANARLEQLGVDLGRDPLLQVLPSSQIARSLKDYADRYGETAWSETDWAVVLGAGLVATLLDIYLVRIPRDETFLGKKYAGSAMTKWLHDRERSDRIYKHFKPLEEDNKTPFDAPHTKATGGLVQGMRSKTHRLQSFGHDPLLGLLIGVIDLMQAVGTYVDVYGKIVRVPREDMEPVRLIKAMLIEVRHLLSDFYTRQGVPPPLFSLLQIGQVGSPFVIKQGGAKLTWTHVARHMYVNGYDLRHFFTMGVVPATVTAMITGYWMLDGLATRGPDANRTADRAKLASMLLVGHAIAMSGNLLKTGVIFGMNPMALNWAQLLAMAPVTVAWIAESAARDARIRRGLDDEWQRLLVASEDPTRRADGG